MKQADYDRQYGYNRPKNKSWINKKVESFGAVLTKTGRNKAILRRLPIITWLFNYQKGNLLQDVIAGVTTGIYNVPQAMSYSTLAGLPPVYGLYASFFPPLLYAIFGSSKHTSIGVFAITCLMVNKCLQRMLKVERDAELEHSHKFSGLTLIEIATSLCLLTGIVQAIMALSRCDKMMKFLSAPAISAITFSACFFGVISQIPKLCGFSVPARNERWFNLFYSIYDLFVNCHKSNLVTIAISACALFILIGSKVFIDPKLKKHPTYKQIPFPKELITIIAATSFSYFLNLEKNYGVKIIHEIPRGFPDPAFPRVDIWPYIIQDAVSIAVVAYAVAISMGQMFSRIHNYRIDSNQELLALGLINIFSSFFATFPTSASLSRTLVNEEAGAKTQLSGIVSCLVILSVITIIGPLLACLPSCVLAAIVLVVVNKLLMNVTKLPKLWKCSKHDFWVWIFTAAVTLCSDIAEGVAAGIFSAILTIAIQSQQPTIKQLGQIRPNDFRPLSHYGSAKETSFRIIRFDAPLIFANVDKFEDNLRDATAETEKKRSASVVSQEDPDWTAIILDCHTWTYTDSMGIEKVKTIDGCLKQSNILLLFANLKSSLRRQYEDAGLLEQISQRQMYPSIQDALDAAHELLANQKSFFDVEIQEKPVEKF
ncbi:unnamed protein product [Caenorhabditis sp. 36 PRJEB53466]|nr:unnamed protein product [Caenorhabditis sp. 36 PRJEB53466]